SIRRTYTHFFVKAIPVISGNSIYSYVGHYAERYRLSRHTVLVKDLNRMQSHRLGQVRGNDDAEPPSRRASNPCFVAVYCRSSPGVKICADNIDGGSAFSLSNQRWSYHKDKRRF